MAQDDSYTVIEIEIHLEHLESLLAQGLAMRAPLTNVPFQDEQVWFHPNAFDFVNKNAQLRPYSGEI